MARSLPFTSDGPLRSMCWTSALHFFLQTVRQQHTLCPLADTHNQKQKLGSAPSLPQKEPSAYLRTTSSFVFHGLIFINLSFGFCPKFLMANFAADALVLLNLSFAHPD